MGFKKIQFFYQNPKVLAYGFSENHQFTEKTDRNSVFLYRDPHILDLLYLSQKFCLIKSNFIPITVVLP
jgi:hypothetical protein